MAERREARKKQGFPKDGVSLFLLKLRAICLYGNEHSGRRLSNIGLPGILDDLDFLIYNKTDYAYDFDADLFWRFHGQNKREFK